MSGQPTKDDVAKMLANLKMTNGKVDRIGTRQDELETQQNEDREQQTRDREQQNRDRERIQNTEYAVEDIQDVVKNLQTRTARIENRTIPRSQLLRDRDEFLKTHRLLEDRPAAEPSPSAIAGGAPPQTNQRTGPVEQPVAPALATTAAADQKVLEKKGADWMTNFMKTGRLETEGGSKPVGAQQPAANTSGGLGAGLGTSIHAPNYSGAMKNQLPASAPGGAAIPVGSLPDTSGRRDAPTGLKMAGVPPEKEHMLCQDRTGNVYLGEKDWPTFPGDKVPPRETKTWMERHGFNNICVDCMAHSDPCDHLPYCGCCKRRGKPCRYMREVSNPIRGKRDNRVTKDWMRFVTTTLGVVWETVKFWEWPGDPADLLGALAKRPKGDPIALLELPPPGIALPYRENNRNGYRGAHPQKWVYDEFCRPQATPAQRQKADEYYQKEATSQQNQQAGAQTVQQGVRTAAPPTAAPAQTEPSPLREVPEHLRNRWSTVEEFRRGDMFAHAEAVRQQDRLDKNRFRPLAAQPTGSAEDLEKSSVWQTFSKAEPARGTAAVAAYNNRTPEEIAAEKKHRQENPEPTPAMKETFKEKKAGEKLGESHTVSTSYTVHPGRG